MEIADFHKPEFIFLENVPNLKGHDQGNTWQFIFNKLSTKYDVKEKVRRNFEQVFDCKTFTAGLLV